MRRRWIPDVAVVVAVTLVATAALVAGLRPGADGADRTTCRLRIVEQGFTATNLTADGFDVKNDVLLVGVVVLNPCHRAVSGADLRLRALDAQGRQITGGPFGSVLNLGSALGGDAPVPAIGPGQRVGVAGAMSTVPVMAHPRQSPVPVSRVAVSIGQTVWASGEDDELRHPRFGATGLTVGPSVVSTPSDRQTWVSFEARRESAGRAKALEATVIFRDRAGRVIAGERELESVRASGRSRLKVWLPLGCDPSRTQMFLAVSPFQA